MKPKGVATLNAGKFKAGFQFVKNAGILILLSLLLVIISCDKSDDLDTIGNEPPIVDQPPTDNETPPDETPPEETPPDDESPPNDDPPNEDESIIIYTDIEPDFTSEDLYDSYNLDLNNDQIIDFTVSSDSDEGYEWLWIASIPIANNGIISVGYWESSAVPLNSGEEIFNLGGYINGGSYEIWGYFDIGYCFPGEQGCSYDWKDKVDKYLGLRFTINGQIHYGWARMDVTSITQWVIKDYAYNATPNKPILAGQKN